MKHDPAIDVVYGDRLEFGEWDRLVQIGAIHPEALWTMNMIDNCALIRRSYLDRCGGYEVNLVGTGFEDWELWLNGLSQEKRLKIRYLNIPFLNTELEVFHDSSNFSFEKTQDKAMSFPNRKYPGVGHGGFD